ncbi:MAG: transcriptional regulator [Azospirillum sp.]|nr:transcriptional regulator [Azospirillum sp.]
MTEAKRSGRRSGCPIATTLEIVGDRWTLVILRDMLTGKTRFSQFLDSPEKITTNILTDRLALMEREGLVRKIPYQLRPQRFEYSLTDKGEALFPVVQEMCRWANRFMGDTWRPPESFMARRSA